MRCFADRGFPGCDGCSTLAEKVCEVRKCSFFKTIFQYEQDLRKYPIKKAKYKGANKK